MIQMWRGRVCWLLRDENGKPKRMVDLKAYLRMQKIKNIYERSNKLV